MHYFTDTDMEMLHEMGYGACYVEDLEEGDEIAFALNPVASRDRPKVVEFSRVTKLKRVPRYKQDMHGHTIGQDPDYLMQWISVRDDGLTRPMQYGSGWAVYRKREEGADP